MDCGSCTCRCLIFTARRPSSLTRGLPQSSARWSKGSAWLFTAAEGSAAAAHWSRATLFAAVLLQRTHWRVSAPRDPARSKQLSRKPPCSRTLDGRGDCAALEREARNLTAYAAPQT